MRAPTERLSRPTKTIEVSLDEKPTWLRFVAAAALHRTGLSRKELAETLDIAPSNVSHQLLYQKDGPSSEFLTQLELLVKQPDLAADADVLRNLAELRNEAYARPIEPSRVPGLWFATLAANPPRNVKEAILQGESLLNLLQSRVPPVLVRASDASEKLKEERKVLLDRGENVLKVVKLVDQSDEALDLVALADKTLKTLLDVTGGPPTTGWTATHLLSQLAEFLPGRLLGHMKVFLQGSGVGFRCIRVAGGALELLDSVHASGRIDLNRRAVLCEFSDFLRWVHETDPDESYPARSFLVEALRLAPQEDPDGVWGWVPDALYCRLEQDKRPDRERMYAMWALLNRNEIELARKAIADFERSDNDALSYAAACVKTTLEAIEEQADLGDVDKRKRRRNQDQEQELNLPVRWPAYRPEYGIATSATSSDRYVRDVPTELREGLSVLARGTLLHIDGTERRFLINLIRRCDFAEQTVRTHKWVAQHKMAPTWLAGVAAFVLGHLQTTSAVHALHSLAVDDAQPGSIRHAALWGIGETVSTARIRQLKNITEKVLEAATAGLAAEEAQVRRASAYAAAMLAQRLNDQQDDHDAGKIRSKIGALLKNAQKEEDEEADRKDLLVLQLIEWGRRIIRNPDIWNVTSVETWAEEQRRSL